MTFTVEVDVEPGRWEVEITDPQKLEEYRVLPNWEAAAKWIGDYIACNADAIDRAERANSRWGWA